MKLDPPIDRPDCRPNHALGEAQPASHGFGTYWVTPIKLDEQGDNCNGGIQADQRLDGSFHFSLPNQQADYTRKARYLKNSTTEICKTVIYRGRLVDGCAFMQVGGLRTCRLRRTALPGCTLCLCRASSQGKT